MLTNTEVADVLEKAADLYQSEQIEWCQGSWEKESYHVKADLGVQAYFTSNEAVIGAMMEEAQIAFEKITSMCASGALARASGLPVLQAQEIESLVPRLTLWPDNRNLYILAREAVLKTIRSQSTNPFRADDPYLTNNIPQWNDEKSRTKQEVIDVFRETAKDLRNAG